MDFSIHHFLRRYLITSSKGFWKFSQELLVSSILHFSLMFSLVKKIWETECPVKTLHMLKIPQQSVIGRK